MALQQGYRRGGRGGGPPYLPIAWTDNWHRFLCFIAGVHQLKPRLARETRENAKLLDKMTAFGTASRRTEWPNLGAKLTYGNCFSAVRAMALSRAPL